MFSSLKLWNFGSGTLRDEELKGNTFILKTCQRTLVISFDQFPFNLDLIPSHEIHIGQNAYLFMLETICGLKSKLIGENEIVGQFKDAYKLFVQSTLKDTKLLMVLEKLFKDAKEIRTQYLIGISQKTYASLTKKHLIQRARANHVMVIGSGQLAEDLINQFKKKAQVSICARNTARVAELAGLHNLTVVPWEERGSIVNQGFIANTVGHNSVLFDQNFFDEWAGLNEQRLFVDLGSPSVIHTSFTLKEHVVRLHDIFNEGAVIEEQKQHQIYLARAAMLSITLKRQAIFEQKINRAGQLVTPQITSDMRYI